MNGMKPDPGRKGGEKRVIQLSQRNNFQ